MDYLRKISKITNREYYESKGMNYDEMKSMFSEELLSIKFHVDDYFYSDFLLGQGVEIESIKSEKFNVADQLDKLKQLGGTMLACGTCIKSRDMQFEACPISTMKDMLKLVVESDRVLTF